MFSTPDLTIAFIRKRPESAGRVLSRMAPDGAAAFLEAIPTRFAVQAVAHMRSRAAALVVQHMGVTAGAALIRDLGFAEASTILREIEPGGRAQILAQLPRRLRRDCEMALAFPIGTVGARMTSAVATLTASETTADALALLRQVEREHADELFVVDEQRKLIGVVSVTTLLRRPASTPLAAQLDSPCVALSANTRVETIANLDAWQTYHRLPVVSRRGVLIGVLSVTALRDPASRQFEPGPSARPSLALSMLDALATSALGLMDLLLGSPSLSAGAGARNER